MSYVDNDSYNEDDEDVEDGNNMNTLDIIEQVSKPRSMNQQKILDTIMEHGYIREEDGTINIDRAMEYIDVQKQHAYETFGRYGRLAHYTTNVDEPMVEVVGTPSGRGADVSASVLHVIAEYATVNDDGSVDGSPVEDHKGPNGQYHSATTIYRNIGRHCRVNLPWDERPLDESQASDEDIELLWDDNGGPFNSAILNETISKDEVPRNPIEALEYGFEYGRSIERMKDSKP